MTFKKVLGFILVIFPVTVALVFGCMKRPPETVDKGVQVSCADVNLAEALLIQGSVQSIKQGEFSSDISSQTLADQAPYATKRHLIQVLERGVNSPNIHLYEEFQNINPDGTYQDLVTRDYWVATSPQNSMSMAKSLVDKSVQSKSMILTNMGAKPMAESKSGEGYCRYPATFHNLKTETIFVPIPDLVKAQAMNLCGRLKDCSRPIVATQMSVDLWFQLDDGKSEQKFTLLTQVSNEVPFFASVLKNCVQQPVQLTDKGNPIIVTECNDVKNFSFGADPSPTPTPTPTL